MSPRLLHAIRADLLEASTLAIVVFPDTAPPQHSPAGDAALQRERSWFNRAVANAGTPQTNVLVLGTALHRDCLVLRLSRAAGWQARTFRAIERWPDRTDLWGQWEQIFTAVDDAAREGKARAFYEAQAEELSRGCVLLWPERESLYELMVHRTTIGHAAGRLHGVRQAGDG